MPQENNSNITKFGMDEQYYTDDENGISQM